MTLRTLYICYFGLNEPLVQTQVLPYLRELQKDGIEISLLTFEPEFRKRWSPSEIEATRTRLEAEGIDWHATGYHKRPSLPATAFDILNGARIVSRLLREKRFDVLHGRTLIGVVIAALARKFSGSKPKIIYDMRGFFAEEYTDAGIWPEGGSLYRTAKAFDRWGIGQANGFVVLTERAQEILFPESRDTGRDKLGRPVEVIPCCIDPARFSSSVSRSEVRRRMDLGDRFVIAYVGSFGGWYMTDEMLEFFRVARQVKPDVFIMVLTQRDVEGVKDKLRTTGHGEADSLVATVPHNEVPEYLAAADIAVSFIKPCYSKQASSPTKIAEYLACGLPVVANAGVGDMDEQLTADHVGVLIESFDEHSYREALERASQLRDMAERCRSSARQRFDLERVGGPRYRRLYKNLLQR